MANGNNNGLPVRSYSKEFKELLPSVIAKRGLFTDFFAGDVEALDGIKNSAIAFSVKTSDIAVAINTYDTGANVGFGTGTGKTSRFGNRTEIKYIDTDVQYTWNYAWHEGIDRATVNADFDEAVADRMEAEAIAKTAQFTSHYSSFISTNATAVALAGLTEANVVKLFNDMHKAMVNANVDKTLTWVAKVKPDVYSILVDSGLTTTSKGSTVNIDRDTVEMFKGFVIEEYPDSAFQSNEWVYAYPVGVAKSFTGIVTARAIESEDFDGVALQGYGKAGEYIPVDNKAAVLKATYTQST